MKERTGDCKTHPIDSACNCYCCVKWVCDEGSYDLQLPLLLPWQHMWEPVSGTLSARVQHSHQILTAGRASSNGSVGHAGRDGSGEASSSDKSASAEGGDESAERDVGAGGHQLMGQLEKGDPAAGQQLGEAAKQGVLDIWVHIWDAAC